MHGDGRGPSRAGAGGSEGPGRGVGAPSLSGGGWRRRDRDRERSQPLQLSPRAVRREAAAAPKAMNEGGERGRCLRSPERCPPPHRKANGVPGVLSARPLVYPTGACPERPPIGPGAPSPSWRSSDSPARPLPRPLGFGCLPRTFARGWSHLKHANLLDVASGEPKLHELSDLLCLSQQ